MLPLMKDINFNGKRVIVRVDLNVPVDEDGKITNDARIKSCIPTIKYLLKHNAAIILISHFGRPKFASISNEISPSDLKKYSLRVLVSALEKELETKVKFIDGNWVDGFNIDTKEIVLCENVRFFFGETKNDPELSKKMASLGDVFVLDAFASAHRAHSSTTGISKYIKEKAAGMLLEKEINSLNKFLRSPQKPILAIVGGSKVSTKLEVLNNFISKVDYLILGGGLANTFLRAKGYDIGLSLYEEDLVDVAKGLLNNSKSLGTEILLPQDVVVAKDIGARSCEEKTITKILADDKILDVGKQTIENYLSYIEKAETILWNGPIGVFEIEKFAKGTEQIAYGVAKSRSFSLVGGGDTIAAIEKYNVVNKFSYISTGGGAFLEFITGKELPAIKALYE